ncbi:MAG: response regulator, partial [Fervidobacterium sp.]
IFMDVLMPELDGLEATKRIRGVDLDTPIVALTAHALKNVRDEVLSVGMNDFVTKPIKIEEIERILEKFCSHLSVEPSLDEAEKETQIKKEQTEKLEIITESVENNTNNEAEEKIKKIKESVEKAIIEGSFDNTFAKELIGTFLDSAKKSMNNIVLALKNGNFEIAQLEAHSIKGAARTLNLEEMSNLAYGIEQHAKEKSSDFDYEENLKILEDWINKFEMYYQKFFE